jgi:hypothetical protein
MVFAFRREKPVRPRRTPEKTRKETSAACTIERTPGAEKAAAD